MTITKIKNLIYLYIGKASIQVVIVTGASSNRQEARIGIERGVRHGRVHGFSVRSYRFTNDLGRCQGVRTATIQRQEEETATSEEKCPDEVDQRGSLQLLELRQRIRARGWKSQTQEAHSWLSNVSRLSSPSIPRYSTRQFLILLLFFLYSFL